MRAAAEAALIAALVAPVAMTAAVRRTLPAAGRARLLVLGAMLALALAGQLALGARSFPFVEWRMYGAPVKGDATVYEYDAVVRSGRRVALVPGDFLAPESADRLMEALRRQVEALKRGRGDRAVHERALGAVTALHDEEHPDDPVEAIVVTQRIIHVPSGERGGPPIVLWRIPR